MKTYAERIGWAPAFAVSYRFFSPEEGGRSQPPRQHVRWDFMYEGDDPIVDGISMIWPEFLGPHGQVLPEGEVPIEGQAHMFIVNPDRIPTHKLRIKVGVRGFFMEGARKVAQCEVSSVLSLAQEGAA